MAGRQNKIGLSMFLLFMHLFLFISTDNREYIVHVRDNTNYYTITFKIKSNGSCMTKLMEIQYFIIYCHSVE
jgi:hypothetical protein